MSGTGRVAHPNNKTKTETQGKDMSGAFEGMNNATRGFASNYLLPGEDGPGKYVARIDECVTFEKEGKGRMWKISLTLLAIEKGVHRVGEEVQVFFKLDSRYPSMFFGKIKGFIAGVMGVADGEVGEAETEEVLSEKNPLAGMVTVVTATASPSKTLKNDDGTPKLFTNYMWGTSLDDDEIEAAIGAEAVEKFFPNM